MKSTLWVNAGGKNLGRGIVGASGVVLYDGDVWGEPTSWSSGNTDIQGWRQTRLIAAHRDSCYTKFNNRTSASAVLRANDAEVKVLDALAWRILSTSSTAKQVFLAVRGQPICASCLALIAAFEREFGVDVSYQQSS